MGGTETNSKKFRRKLTPFLCQEMLYDYAIDRLDPERKQAVEDFLATDKECRDLLEGIRAAIEYTGRLSATQASEAVCEHLRESENVISLGKRYSSWKEWPESLRWSVMAIGISSVVAATVALIPWQMIPGFRDQRPKEYIEIAQIPNSSSQLVAVEEASDLEASETDEGSGDDLIDDGKMPLPVAGKIAKLSDRSGDDQIEETPSALGMKDKKAVVAAPGKPTPVAALVPELGRPTKSISTPSELADTSAADSATFKKDQAKAKGFVFRAFMTLSNLDELGPKITTSIQEFGGEKAGEVELGWKRGSGRYYHFSIPELNESALLEKLRAYGPVRISKDPHPRVMPAGQVRFILWVESAN
jgi:hypothetical protein